MATCALAFVNFGGARAFAAPAGPDTYTIKVSVAVAPGETANVSVGTQVTAQISAIGSDGKTDATSAVPFAIGTTDAAADVTDDAGAAVPPTGLQLKSGTSHVLVTFKTAGSWTVIAIVNGVPIASAPIQVAAAVAAAPPASAVPAPAPVAVAPAPAPAVPAPAPKAGAPAPEVAAPAPDAAAPAPDAAASPAGGGKPPKPYDDLCARKFNDCDWIWHLVGGAEESALSAQDSETNPFISLFVRAPWNIRAGSVWLQARFLGAANANNTNNVVSAFQSATGSSSTSGLPQVGTALDYIFGAEHDFFQPNPGNPDRGMFTLGVIAAFGATTPLSAQSAAVAYQVPAYGTNECTQLLSRFPSSRGAFGLPAQPMMGNAPDPYISTVTTPSGGATATTTTAGPYCIINPVQTTTTNSSGAKVVTSGIQIQDIAFAPEDRNSFLLKYMVGVRLINRWLSNSSAKGCGTDAKNGYVPCVRSVADFTFGQDESITGGQLRKFVFKAEAVFPIPNTSAYFFGSSALRLEGNQTFAPLLLEPASIVTATASAPAGTPPATTTVPSSTTWVLPLTQPNRDLYRIGVGIDLSAVLSKVFASANK